MVEMILIIEDMLLTTWRIKMVKMICHLLSSIVFLDMCSHLLVLLLPLVGSTCSQFVRRAVFEQLVF